MSVLSSPKSLYIIRLVQFFLAVGVLVLICYGGVHRGWWKWWDGINGALAVGGTSNPSRSPVCVHDSRKCTVITVILSFVVTLHGIITHHLKTNPFAGVSTARMVMRLVFEVVLFLLWIASATLLLRYPKNCDTQADGKCFKPVTGITTDFKDLGDQPVAPWDAAIALSFAEM